MPQTRHNPFSIKASTVKANTAEIFIYGDIGEVTAVGRWK